MTVGGTAYRIDKMSESIDTPAGGITGPIRVVPEDATTGCEATDFAGQDFTGSVALIRRGGCTFEQKSLNAAAAGAVAAVISNNTAGPLTNVTITNEGPIPVGGISQADGTTLAVQAGTAATVDMRYEEQTRTSKNVIAETRTGKKNNVVMAGAHLDAVYAGINDNGTGSAALLNVATHARRIAERQQQGPLRLVGCGRARSDRLRRSRWRARRSTRSSTIALYLNFDMVGSPNCGLLRLRRGQLRR